MTALMLPRLRRDQYQIASHPAKTKVLAMGRRWGKTVLGGVLTLNVLRQHGRVAWVAPTYKNTRAPWRWASSTCAPLAQKRIFDISKSERVITSHRGGFFGVFSADNIDAIRGEAFHLVVIDEAARISEEAYQDAIRPTLADADGDDILISSPKGKNWFFVEHLKGQADGRTIASWTAPTSANPNPRIQRAALLARDRVPDRSYRQEWLAEFVEDGGVFRRINDAATATAQGAAVSGHQYIMGADWGKSNDYTVLTIIDMTTKELVALDRFNIIDYTLQLGRLQALYDCFRPIVIMAEANSIGAPIIEQLWRLNLPVQPFVTTNVTKARVVEDLSLAFEQQTIRILNDPILIGELQAYEVSRTPTGMPQYSAPSGIHDDCVISLALAWSAAHEQVYVR